MARGHPFFKEKFIFKKSFDIFKSFSDVTGMFPKGMEYMLEDLSELIFFV